MLLASAAAAGECPFRVVSWVGQRYGLVMGYNNVRSYQEAVDLLERPKRQTLTLLS